MTVFKGENVRNVVIEVERLHGALQIFECVKGDKPVIHVDRWQTHELNPKTQDQLAVDW